MIDRSKSAYLDVARASLGLAIQLERWARQSAIQSDLDGIRTAYTELEQFLQHRAKPSVISLFATPEGLGVTIHTSKRLFPVAEEAEKLTPLADELHTIVKSFGQTRTTGPVRNKAKRLSELFREIHDYAEELAVEGRSYAPRSDLERALAASSSSR